MRYLSILFLAMFLSLSAFSQTSLAATEDTSGDGVVTTQTAAVADVAVLSQQAAVVVPTYDGITIKQPTKVPSAFGMFWRGVTENVTLTFTFDPNKKAEKALQFSEERMLIAEKALESPDPKTKQTAQENLNRAHDLKKTAQASQEKALEKPTEETTHLLKNSAVAADRQQEIFDRIEQKTNGENLDQVLDVRAKMTEESQRLETAISNDKIPQDVRDHLKEVKSRIELHATEVEQRVAEAKQLKDAIANGDESAKIKLDEFKTQRLEEIKKNINERQAEFQKFQDKITEIKVSAEKGDETAVEMMKQIEQMPDLKNKFQEIENEVMDQRQQPDDRRGPSQGVTDQSENQSEDDQQQGREGIDKGDRDEKPPGGNPSGGSGPGGEEG